MNTSNTETHGEILQLVGFELANEQFGINIHKVHEIIRSQSLTRVPNLPSYVDGVINLRGKVIPVIDLRRRLGLEKGDRDKKSRIVVVEVAGRTLGFAVDAVSQIVRVDPTAIEEVPQLGSMRREHVKGIGRIADRLMLLLDLDKLIEEPSDEMTIQSMN